MKTTKRSTKSTGLAFKNKQKSIRKKSDLNYLNQLEFLTAEQQRLFENSSIRAAAEILARHKAIQYLRLLNDEMYQGQKGVSSLQPLIIRHQQAIEQLHTVYARPLKDILTITNKQ